MKETWGDCTLIPLYDNEDSVCGIIYNDAAYYFYKNLQGDVIEIKNANGLSVARYTYDAWGRVISIKNENGLDVTNNAAHLGNVNPFRYRGYYYDTEIGMYYLQSRYYDPAVGRFINGDDPATAISNLSLMSRNIFVYCENDPINNTDSNGGISWKSALKFFELLLKIAKNVFELLKAVAEGFLKLYTSLSPKDITQIARDINAHRKDVRKSISSLTDKFSKVKSKYGKIAIAISIILFLVSIAASLTDGKTILDLVSSYIVTGLVEAIKWGLNKIVTLVLKAIPAVGVVLGFIIGTAFSIFLNILFSLQFVKKITDAFESRVNAKVYTSWEYLCAFFKSIKESKQGG